MFIRACSLNQQVNAIGIQNNNSQWTTPVKEALILVMTNRYISLNSENYVKRLSYNTEDFHIVYI